jgi:hypothetical protein
VLVDHIIEGHCEFQTSNFGIEEKSKMKLLNVVSGRDSSQSVVRHSRFSFFSHSLLLPLGVLHAFCASALKSISDPRLLTSGLCALFFALCGSAPAQPLATLTRVCFLSSRSGIEIREDAFVFIVNLKTAKQIGLTIPPTVLARADRVIR